MRRLALACAAFAACAETDPLPSPAAPEETVLITQSLVFVSSVKEASSDPSTVAVAGLPGAVEEEGQILLVQKRGGAQVGAALTLDISAEGAFAAVLQAFGQDLLAITFRRTDGKLSPTIELTVPGPPTLVRAGAAEAAPTIGAPTTLAADDFDSSSGPRFTAHPPDAAGGAKIEGADLTPGLEALAAVPAHASTARALVDADGKFSVRVRADAGDTVYLFTRDPVDGHTSPAGSIVVPAQ